ncbi:hypothetical protein, partial [Pseudomonas viridiflava]|uniref:hypothetical protein n=1 Tax=Pseudomonas viridiflava TaxID=33069 RepID=UPI001E2AED5C
MSGTIVDPNDGRRAENSTPLSRATAFSRVGELFNLNTFICLGSVGMFSERLLDHSKFEGCLKPDLF